MKKIRLLLLLLVLPLCSLIAQSGNIKLEGEIFYIVSSGSSTYDFEIDFLDSNDNSTLIIPSPMNPGQLVSSTGSFETFSYNSVMEFSNSPGDRVRFYSRLFIDADILPEPEEAIMERILDFDGCLTTFDGTTFPGTVATITLVDLGDIDDNNSTLNTQIDKCNPNETIQVKASRTSCSFSYAVRAVYQSEDSDVFVPLLPYATRSSDFSFTLNDIFGANDSSDFRLQIEYIDNPTATKDRSGFLAFEVNPCIPELDATVSPNPRPINTTCNSRPGDGLDGGFEVTFNRELTPTESMAITVFREITPGNFSPVDGTPDGNNLTASDFSNRSYTFIGTDMPAGNYRITWLMNGAIVDGSDSGEFLIASPTPIVTAPPTITRQPTCAEPTGRISLSASGGGFPPNPNVVLDYGMDNNADGNADLWQSSSIFDNLDPGTYQFLARSRSNPSCISVISELRTINPVTNPVTVSASASANEQPTTSTSDDGSVTANVTEATGAITYELFLAPDFTSAIETGSSNTFSGLDEGTYRVQATDGDGCSNTSNDVVLAAVPIPSLTLNNTPAISCLDANDGTVNFTISGGVTPYSFRWVTPTTDITGPVIGGTFIRNLLEPGDYELIVSSADARPGASQSSGTITLTNPDAVTLNATPNDASCNGVDDAFILVEATGGNSYQYRFGSSLTWIDLPANNRIPIEVNTNYGLLIRNENECESNIVTNIIANEPDAIIITELVLSHVDNTVFGGSLGVLEVTISNNVGITQYSWQRNGIDFTLPAGSTDTRLINLPEGRYTLSVIDGNLCTGLSEEIRITEPAALSVGVPAAAVTDVLCFGESTGRIVANYQGTGPFEFIWFNDAGDELQRAPQDFIENLPAGTYSYTINDSSNAGPLPSGDIMIVRPTAALTASLTQTEITCLGDTNGTITVTPLGGTAPFQYAISGGFALQPTLGSFTNLAAGTYTITVTDANGCTTAMPLSTTLLPPDPIVFDDANAVTPVSASGASDGSISVTVQGGTQPYFYRWSGPIALTPINAGNTTTIGNLPEGVYQLEVSNKPTFDIDGCYFPKQYIVGAPAPQGITPTITNIDCKGDDTGAIDVVIIGETPNSYQWTFADDSAITTSNGTTTEDISGLLAETYVLTITYADASTFRSADIEITEPTDEITAEIPVSTNITCNGGNDGSITIIASGGTVPLTYSLDGAPAQTSNLFENLQSGSYVVTVIDANMCTLPLAAITISQPDPVTFIDNQTIIQPVSTNGGADGSITAVLTGGSTPYVYEWSVLNGAVLPETSNVLSNLAQGTYVLRVSNTNAFALDGCFIEREFTVPEPGPLSISNIISVNVDCRGNASGSIGTTVIGEGNITYAWTLDGGAPIPVSNGTDAPNISGISAGTYVLTVTDDNSTVSSNPIIITEPAQVLDISGITSTDATCFDGTDGAITITAIGGTAPYEYSVDDGTTYQNQNSFASISTGSYTIRVRDFNGCTFLEPGTTFINQPQELELTITDQQSLSAAGASDGAITVSVTGGTAPLTYNWAGPGTFDRTSPSISGLIGGEYIVTVTDANGCPLVSNPITIAEPGVLLAGNSQTVFLECNGDDFAEITANAQGGVSPYTYQWFQVIGGNNNELTEDTNIIANLSAGEYFVRITDANSISADGDSVTISEPASIAITLDSQVNVLCASEETGALNISVIGGTPPYSYVWSSGQSTQDISNIPAGSYIIEIGDANMCFTDATFEITAPADALQITNASVTDVSSYQGSNGSIALDISGGATPYTINWTRLSDNTFAGNQPTISSLSADSYQVSITDANGCPATVTYEITQPDIVEDTIVSPTCTGESNGTISVLVNEGNGRFTYIWSTGATTNTITDLAAGTYSVTITGFGDGPLTRNYELADPLPLQVDLGTDRVLCAEQVLELDATVEDETASYLWSSDTGFSSTLPNVILTESGNYSVVVTSQTGCTAEGNILVDISTDEIDAEFALSSQVFEGDEVVAVDISFPLPESIVWEVPVGATIVTQNSDELVLVFENEGEYEIGITTTRGDCVASKTKKVLVIKKDALTEEDKTQAEKVIEDFILYPNPTTGRFTADVSLSERGNISIKVFNFANNAMMASERGTGDTSYSIPFDISGMPSGVYAVLLETPYGTSLRKVVVR